MPYQTLARSGGYLNARENLRTHIDLLANADQISFLRVIACGVMAPVP